MIELERHLRVKACSSAVPEIELFVEKICDQYNIFNSYFGNILFSLSEFFNLLIDKEDSDKKSIYIYFYSSKKGLNFRIFLGEKFFEIAGLCQREIDTVLGDQELSDVEKSLVSIALLVDEMNFDSNLESVDLVFYVSSIHLSRYNERIGFLNSYFEKLQKISAV